MKQNSLCLVLPPPTAAARTGWQQKANVLTVCSTCTLDRSVLGGKSPDNLPVTFNGCQKRQATCNSSQDETWLKIKVGNSYFFDCFEIRFLSRKDQSPFFQSSQGKKSAKGPRTALGDLCCRQSLY